MYAIYILYLCATVLVLCYDVYTEYVLYFAVYVQQWASPLPCVTYTIYVADLVYIYVKKMAIPLFIM
jgi:hypothetical protein